MSTFLSPADVDHIVALTDPTLRNLRITQSYHELSNIVQTRTGPTANWCTFATWASKQAGQSIRREDLRRNLEARLALPPQAQALLQAIAFAFKPLGGGPAPDVIRQSVCAILIRSAVDRTSQAVSLGNQKVFAEIGREFARFNAQCLTDTHYDGSNLENFCTSLRPGPPPEGQVLLRQAFTHYYESFFETNAQTRVQLQLLANLEIGFHEQTRLQPQIAQSMEPVPLNANQLRQQLVDRLLPPLSRWWIQGQRFWEKLMGSRSPLDGAIEALLTLAQRSIRFIITDQLMSLSLPGDRRLALGQDLQAAFPVSLTELSHPELLSLLSRIDLTANSVQASGTQDWANLAERLHFIADLFRCYQEDDRLSEAPFTVQQLERIKQGQVPAGRL